MSLQFDNPQFVTLKMPMRYSERQGTRFIEEHADWICQTLADHPRQTQLRHYLVRHPRIALTGRWYALRMRFHQGNCGYLVDDVSKTIEVALNPLD